MFISHNPFLIIISSPSGAGKSTLCKMIVNNDPLIKLSVSATTRAKREKEIEGQDYHFISEEDFLRRRNKSEFLEFAKVFDYYYATPKKMVEDSLTNGNEMLFDIDWQGARQIKQNYKRDAVVSIFILPPSLSELERRLKNRAQDSHETVKNRMSKVFDEISHHGEYDYVLINDDLNNTYQKIRAIIDAKRIERYSKEQLKNFVNNFNK